MFSTTEISQLKKLPEAFRHFKEHKAENPSITVLRFFVIHYLHGSPKDSDYDKDMKLPFKESGDCVSAISVAYLQQPLSFYIEKEIIFVKKSNCISEIQFFLTSHHSNIWKPPKVC